MKKLTIERNSLRVVRVGLRVFPFPILGLLLFLSSTFNTTAQVASEHVSILDNDKLSAWVNEVYLDCPEFASDEYMKIYRAQCEKVTIIEAEDLSNYQHAIDLGTVGLKNKCNFNLNYDTESTFSVENFNPLKYFFDFYAGEARSYHVHGTNYIITISK